MSENFLSCLIAGTSANVLMVATSMSLTEVDVWLNISCHIIVTSLTVYFMFSKSSIKKK